MQPETNKMTSLENQSHLTLLILFSCRWVHLSARALLVIALLVPSLADAQTAPSQLGGVNVRVMRDGQPVANATVCVGVTGDLNQFFQGVTDSQGRAHFAQVPGDPFLVTANSSGRGAQQSFNFATPGRIPILAVEIALPASGGPSCPTTQSGPSRAFRPNLENFVLPTPPPVRFIQIQNPQHCFGALGGECGQPQGFIPLTALCANGSCLINSGSWDHDECCFRNLQGMACQRGPLDAITGHDGNCVAAWDKAVRLVGKGINWRRNVDFTRVNTTGTVEFNLYCAPRNTLLPPPDSAKCCSRLTRALNVSEMAAAVATLETLAACQ